MPARRWLIGLLPVAALLMAPWFHADPAAQADPSPSEESSARTVWYFYKVKWGHQDDFVELFRRNHYPVLEAQLGSRLTDVRAYTPTYHGDGRGDWTFAVAITFKDAEALTTSVDEEALAKKLFPDFERWQEEERERFTLLDAHWDVPLTAIDLAPDAGQP